MEIEAATIEIVPHQQGFIYSLEKILNNFYSDPKNVEEFEEWLKTANQTNPPKEDNNIMEK